MRLGLNFVKGLRAEIASEIIRQRNVQPFHSIDDVKHRIPALQKSELTALAEIGALNSIAGERGHRRSALWQVERVARPAGSLLESSVGNASDDKVVSSDESNPLHLECEKRATASIFPESPSPLVPMNVEERLIADFRGTGLTVGIHPMAHHRATLKSQGVHTSIELRELPDGARIRIAGAVIARQRPGTAKGFVFLSLEDETGIANAIITPAFYAENTMAVLHEQFVLIEGKLQNKEKVVHVKAEKIMPLAAATIETPVRNFH